MTCPLGKVTNSREHLVFVIVLRNYPLDEGKIGIDATGAVVDDFGAWKTRIISGNFVGMFLIIGQAILQAVASWPLSPFGILGGTKP